ncbi:hypothetical protein RHGRI_013631 [Rhododendron griersonianum]|uniref:Uncharacterized protein n=1 Tax=Rhododendron griersonianum TaxID=479676 RepID=A0AAV6K6A1_9ERIC|nr:hypothetical protein RHGRI_013631 [Rhododendron griersonianum]
MKVEKQVTDFVVTEQKPLQEVFPSDEALVDWIRCIGQQHGFIIVIKSSEKCIKNSTPRMRFSCERSSKYRPFVKKVDRKEVAVKKRVRSTGTKKCECPLHSQPSSSSVLGGPFVCREVVGRAD